jgi:predicted nucleic acid-binding protein
MREGATTPEAIHLVQQAIAARLDDGSCQRVELTRHTYRQAEYFLVTLTATPLRAADALHLALATAARAASMASFDARLRPAARAVGLAIYPPEEP